LLQEALTRTIMLRPVEHARCSETVIARKRKRKRKRRCPKGIGNAGRIGLH
jgi:hypothetical protein